MAECKLCSVLDVKNFLPGKSDFTKNDEVIEQAIYIAGDTVKTYCRTDFKSSTKTEYHPASSNPAKVYFLRDKNVSSLSIKISYANDWDNPLSNTLVEGTDYNVDLVTGRIYMMGSLINYPRALKITYTSGYSVDPQDSTILLVPKPVRRAVAVQAAHVFNAISDSALGVEEKQTKASSMQGASGFNTIIPEVRVLLAPYVLTMVGKDNYLLASTV